MKQVSKQFNPANVGHKREGNILFTIFLLGKMPFIGRSKSYTPVPVRIRTIYSIVLYEPNNCQISVEIVWISKYLEEAAVLGGCTTPLTWLMAQTRTLEKEALHAALERNIFPHSWVSFFTWIQHVFEYVYFVYIHMHVCIGHTSYPEVYTVGIVMHISSLILIHLRKNRVYVMPSVWKKKNNSKINDHTPFKDFLASSTFIYLLLNSLISLKINLLQKFQ